MNTVMERINGGEYKGAALRNVTEADHYHLLPEHKIAIPSCVTAESTFQVVAARLGDWNLPASLGELPTCSKQVLDTCLTDYTIIPVLRSVLVCKPVKVLSPMEEDAIRDAKKKQSSISSKKQYITGKMVL